MGKYSFSDKQDERREARRPVPKKKMYVIPKVSQNSKDELKIYKVLEKDYLKDIFICEAWLENCTYTATEIHHKKGRGINLNNEETFLAVCRNCHRWIEDNPKGAKELGLSVSRLNK